MSETYFVFIQLAFISNVTLTLDMINPAKTE